jgi:hypothetical protein
VIDLHKASSPLAAKFFIDELSKLLAAHALPDASARTPLDAEACAPLDVAA